MRESQDLHIEEYIAGGINAGTFQCQALQRRNSSIIIPAPNFLLHLQNLVRIAKIGDSRVTYKRIPMGCVAPTWDMC